ncbi:MAG: hypothetical protein ACR2MR_13580 [Dietzia maris]
MKNIVVKKNIKIRKGDKKVKHVAGTYLVIEDSLYKKWEDKGVFQLIEDVPEEETTEEEE